MVFPAFYIIKDNNALHKAVKAMSILMDTQKNKLMHLEILWLCMEFIMQKL